MIEQIQINDLGVISHASLPLGPGFTVLTGETGAGKTMVVTALGLLLGERADTARVRQGREHSWVEGHFLAGSIAPITQRVDELGGVIEEGELVLSRQVSAEGRSKAVVGGRSAPVSVLQELAQHLVVVHGQSDQIRLKSETAQRGALDRFAGERLAAVLSEYRELFSAHQERLRELDHLDERLATQKAEQERLREALDRIEQVRPEPGEDTALKALSDKLESIEDLRQAAAGAKEALSSEALGPEASDVRGLIDQAIRSLERVVERDGELSGPIQTLRDGLFHIDEASHALSSYLSAIVEGESLDLESVMVRRAELGGLIRDYGPTLDDVLAFEQTASDTLLEIDLSGDRRGELDAQVVVDQETLARLAAEITERRMVAAATLGERVSGELQELAMPDARLVIDVSPRQATVSGADQVSFLLAPHPGASPRPLAKSASGGELSRVMLSLEVVLAEADPVPTFIFDEVDAGVGGATALEIGKRLARLAQSAQVICVTHLAQVASYADTHLSVFKDRSGEVTESSVRVLEGEVRVAELARMLGGDQDSDSAKAHAREMLARQSVSRSSGG